jgi:DNA-binding transcriptional MerR regulator
MPARHVGVFAISVAAEMADTSIQNLRVYERKGLLSPGRTTGGTRLYSAADVDRLIRIRDLLDLGLNLAGVAVVLQLEAENARLRQEVRRLQGARRTPRNTQGPA